MRPFRPGMRADRPGMRPLRPDMPRGGRGMPRKRAAKAAKRAGTWRPGARSIPSRVEIPALIHPPRHPSPFTSAFSAPPPPSPLTANRFPNETPHEGNLTHPKHVDMPVGYPHYSAERIMNPYDTPKTASDGGDFSLKRYMPPRIVIISISGLALTQSFGIAKMVYLASQRGTFRLEPMGPIIEFFVGMGILTGIIYLLLRGLYRGSKIAFWIIVAPVAFNIIAYKYSLNQFARYQTQWEKGLFLFQGIVQLLSAVALLSPQSWRWFHKKKFQTELSR